MKKKFLLSSGILALVSPFISATCVVKNKSENDNPAASSAPNPITPPTTEPVTPPNTHPSAQPAPNPITPPTNNPVTPPNTQPSNPPVNDKLEKERGKKHEEASAKLTADLFSDANGRSAESIKSRIYRDSISGLDIDWNPRRDKELEIASKIDNLIAIEVHNESSSESTLRLFDDTYTDAKNKALLEKAKRDVAESNNRVERNSRSIEIGNWTGISKDEEEKLRKQLTDISESILNNDPNEWERKEEARKVWEAALSKVPFWEDINSKGLKEEYKAALSRKHKLLLDYLKKLEEKNNSQISYKTVENAKYISLLKNDLEEDRKALENAMSENEKALASVKTQLENSESKEKLAQIKSQIEDFKELMTTSENEFKKYDEKTSYYNWLLGLGIDIQNQRNSVEAKIIELEAAKSALEKQISEIESKFSADLKEVEKDLQSEKNTKFEKYKELKSIAKDIEDYDKYWMYTMPSATDPLPNYLEEISRLSQYILVLKTTINDLIKFKSVLKTNKNIDVAKIKAPLSAVEKEKGDLEKVFEELKKADIKINTELSKNHQENENNKREKEAIAYDIKNIDSYLVDLLYAESTLTDQFNKLEEEKKSLEAKNKEISDNLAKLDEKEELISTLEEMYEAQVEELEEIAHNSEKDLNEYIKKVEKELKSLN
ncbi:hypothetical protein MBOVa_1050 [Mycoplasmopsis bovis 8790]|nr:hypothetical protein MBOVa_1050 [Mycoplasmopsis bovis 8790]